MDDLHGPPLPILGPHSLRTRCRPGEGGCGLAFVARPHGNNPRFPWSEPSTTKLISGRARTTVRTASDRDDPHIVHPAAAVDATTCGRDPSRGFSPIHGGREAAYSADMRGLVTAGRAVRLERKPLV